MSPGRFVLLIGFAAVMASAQPAPTEDDRRERRPPPFKGRGPGQGPERGLAMPPGRWWADPAIIVRLEISEDQQGKIDAVFQRSRLQLIDLSATLQKEEAKLDQLLSSNPIDEQAATAQIDRVSSARSELERANARMLLGFRLVLSQQQWRELQAGRGHGPPRARPQ